jgi:hypothetical protein
VHGQAAIDAHALRGDELVGLAPRADAVIREVAVDANAEIVPDLDVLRVVDLE